MTIGAGSAVLLALAAPATAADPSGGAAPPSPGAGNRSEEGVPTADAMDNSASGANGRVVVMTLSRPQPGPEPRASSNPADLRKHRMAKRPPGTSN
jgi:hypothetical protein